MMRTIRDLRATFFGPGRVEWIGVSPAPRGEIVSLDQVAVEAGRGLVGDHHAKNRRSDRQATLLQWEHLPVVAALCGRQEVDPRMLRRNLAVAGVNVLALKDRRFRIGEAVFQGTGPCEPCSRMEMTLGSGGYNAMRGHGGVTAQVLVGGVVRLGDAVVVLSDADVASR